MNRILLCATLGMAACMGACAQQPSGQSTPLFDDEGRPAANVPAAIPASPAHRTRAGLYITEAQARAQGLTPGDHVLRPDSVEDLCIGVVGARLPEGGQGVSLWIDSLRFVR